MTEPPDRRPRRRPRPSAWILRVAFAVALAVNLVVLYAPDPSTGGVAFPGLDKVVHLTVFATLTLTGLALPLARRWFVPAVLAHAAISEIVQATALPQRQGDLLDLLADVAGVALGMWGARWLRARREGLTG